MLGDKGKVIKANADEQARAEYELFEVRRRLLLEAEGERARQQALEEAARNLPKANGSTT